MLAKASLPRYSEENLLELCVLSAQAVPAQCGSLISWMMFIFQDKAEPLECGKGFKHC